MKLRFNCSIFPNRLSYSGYHHHAPSNGFFFPLFTLEFSWTSINCFHRFPCALTEKVPSLLQTHTQSLFMCFGGERKLRVRLKRARGVMERDEGKKNISHRTLFTDFFYTFLVFPAEMLKCLLLKCKRNFRNLTCLAAISFKPCNTSARVIVYVFYTRPTVQTCVINTVVDVCEKHGSTMYNVADHLNVLVKVI